MKTLSKLPDLVLLPAAHAVPFNGACKCRLPEGLCEFRSQGPFMCSIPAPIFI